MLTILGCGNSNRSDDGVGVVVAKRLAERLARHPVREVQVFDCGTAGVEVMFRARGSDALIVVDASRTGAPPGTVHEVPGEVLESAAEPPLSAHGFRWDHALYAGRKIFGEAFPKEVTVWLVEAASVDFGLDLGPEVAAAADRVYASLLERIAAHAARRAEAGSAALPDVVVRRGVAQVPREIAEGCLAGCATVLPMVDARGARLVPVDERAGGLLFKIRNARGDRAVDLSEVLRHHGWDTDGEIVCRAAWDPDLGALSLTPAESRGEAPR